MGIFDQPDVKERDGDLPELHGKVFRLVGVGLRDVTTVYGPTKAIDLHILVDGETKIYSGFSAGIARQVAHSVPSDFPTWARIETVPLKGGKYTTELVMASDENDKPADDDLPF